MSETDEPKVGLVLLSREAEREWLEMQRCAAVAYEKHLAEEFQPHVSTVERQNALIIELLERVVGLQEGIDAALQRLLGRVPCDG